MSLNKGKHIVEEIENVRCSIVESGITQQRMKFLKDLLTLNHYEVKISRTSENTYIIGVTDLLFNPVIEVYKRRLHTKTGKKVTPAYWLQISDNETEKEMNYWNFKNENSINKHDD